MNNSTTVIVEVQTFLTDGGRRQYEGPEGGVEGIADRFLSVCILFTDTLCKRYREVGTDIGGLLFLAGHPGSEIVQSINLVCGSSYLHGFNHAPMKSGQQFLIPVKTIG